MGKREEERQRRREYRKKIEREECKRMMESTTRYSMLCFWQDGKVIDEWEIHDGFMAIPDVGEVLHYHRGSVPEVIYRKSSPSLYVLGRVIHREFEYYTDFIPDAAHHQHRSWQIVHLFVEPVDASDVAHMQA